MFNVPYKNELIIIIIIIIIIYYYYYYYYYYYLCIVPFFQCLHSNLAKESDHILIKQRHSQPLKHRVKHWEEN